jgi:hypothetical protein
MAFWRLYLRDIFVLALAASIATPLALFTFPETGQGQSLDRPGPALSSTPRTFIRDSSTYSMRLLGSGSHSSEGDGPVGSVDSELLLPAAPEPGAMGGNPERYSVAPAADWRQPPFSRVGIGADISPLGIGIKSAIVLDHYLDARLMGNFLNYNSGRFEAEGFNVNANLHMASAAASLDWYPFGSIWRLSPGLMFFNDNQLSASSDVVGGTSFSLDKQTFYSATTNPATGATPLIFSGVLGLHTNRPAATIAGGFGRFIPRSNRHWSFPSEFGVAFTGAPSINVNVSGWVCLDSKQTQCSNLGNPTSPVSIEFNNALQSSLTRLRKDLNAVQVYPLFSYSVVYSFNIR